MIKNYKIRLDNDLFDVEVEISIENNSFDHAFGREPILTMDEIDIISVIKTSFSAICGNYIDIDIPKEHLEKNEKVYNELMERINDDWDMGEFS